MGVFFEKMDRHHAANWQQNKMPPGQQIRG
jgi:hypothetical protein